MVAENARLQEEASTLDDEAEELLSSLSKISVHFAGETVTVASEEELRSLIRQQETSRGISLGRVFLVDSPNYDIRKVTGSGKSDRRRAGQVA
jgi:predicted RNase H-like nuclease (RuvC/YqgF family)